MAPAHATGHIAAANWGSKMNTKKPLPLMRNHCVIDQLQGDESSKRDPSSCAEQQTMQSVLLRDSVRR
eukprot:12427629-Karenia_brevis.AAC.1